MTISYPLSLPGVKAPKRVNLYAVTKVAVSESPFTFQRQVQRHQGQAWGIDIIWPTMDEDTVGQYQAFLAALNGQEGTFRAGDPMREFPKGTALGTPQVNGAGQSGNILATKGWDISQIGALLAGDYIEVEGYLYKVLNDVDSDGTGLASIDIWPRLRTAPVDSLSIITAAPKTSFRMIENSVDITQADETRTFLLSLKGVEDIA